MLTRNLGACYYYLHRAEPALSNLREYLRREQGITVDDRSEVENWIAEMEKLRSQQAQTPAPAAPVAPPAGAPLPIPAEAVAPVPAPMVEGAPLAAAPAPSPPTPATPIPSVVAPVAPSKEVPAVTQAVPPPAASSPMPPVAQLVPVSPPFPVDGAKPAAGAEALNLHQKSAGAAGAAASEGGTHWWLWTGIGAVVAGGIVTAVLLSTRSPGRDGTCSSGLAGCMVIGK